MSQIVKRIVVAWLVVLLAAACASRRPAAPETRTPIGMSLVELLGRIRDDRPVTDALPKPDKIVTTELPDRNVPGQADTVRTLLYPGLTLTVVQRAGSSAQHVVQLVVTDGGYQTVEGLHVGSSLQALSDALGEADRLEGDEYVYQPKGKTPEVTRFRVEDERIAQMQWDFPID